MADGWMVAGALGNDEDARLLVPDVEARDVLLREADRCCEDDMTSSEVGWLMMLWDVLLC